MSVGFPTLRAVVIDATDAREVAEFWREIPVTWTDRGTSARHQENPTQRARTGSCSRTGRAKRASLCSASPSCQRRPGLPRRYPNNSTSTSPCVMSKCLQRNGTWRLSLGAEVLQDRAADPRRAALRVRRPAGRPCASSSPRITPADRRTCIRPAFPGRGASGCSDAVLGHPRRRLIGHWARGGSPNGRFPPLQLTLPALRPPFECHVRGSPAGNTRTHIAAAPRSLVDRRYPHRSAPGSRLRQETGTRCHHRLRSERSPVCPATDRHASASGIWIHRRCECRTALALGGSCRHHPAGGSRCSCRRPAMTVTPTHRVG